MNITISPRFAYNQANTVAGIMSRKNAPSFKSLDDDIRNMTERPEWWDYGDKNGCGCAVIPLGIALLGLGAACTNTVLEHKDPEPIVEEVKAQNSTNSFVQVFEDGDMYDVECPPDAFLVHYPKVDLGEKLVPVSEYMCAKKNSSKQDES